MLNIYLFILLLLVLVNWFQLIHFSRLFLGQKIKTSEMKDPWIQNTVQKKTGLKLLSIT